MIFFSNIDYFEITYLMICSYLLGSVSFGIVITKIMNLGNLRLIGSGNIGATNVLRTGNKGAAALTVILDGGKGYATIYVTLSLFESVYLPFTGIAVFLGHIFPIYYRFKGGKGVATFLGIVLAVNALIGIIVCMVWLSLALLSKKSSLAALGSSVSTPLFLFLHQPDERIPLVVLLTIFIWWAHKDNIKRLLLKTEPSINFKKNAQE